MYRIKAKIVGLTPLRYNKFVIVPKDEAVSKSKMTEAQAQADAMTRAYRDENGNFYVPKSALRACFINGGKKVKVGRGAASKLLEAILIFEDDRYYLPNNDFEYQQDVVRIPPKTGARILQYWVTLKDWSLEFSAIILDDTFPSKALEDAIKSAGLYYGLLDGRPQLGRFELVSFVKEEIKK